jgi:hypothetical protein
MQVLHFLFSMRSVVGARVAGVGGSGYRNVSSALVYHPWHHVGNATITRSGSRISMVLACVLKQRTSSAPHSTLPTPQLRIPRPPVARCASGGVESVIASSRVSIAHSMISATWQDPVPRSQKCEPGTRGTRIQDSATETGTQGIGHGIPKRDPEPRTPGSEEPESGIRRALESRRQEAGNEGNGNRESGTGATEPRKLRPVTVAGTFQLPTTGEPQFKAQVNIGES